MDKKIISPDRKKYLRQIKFRKISVFITQIGILVGFITLWEVLANLGIIDSFITSQPSRILNTFMNLSSNDLLMHILWLCIWNSAWNLYCNNIVAVSFPFKSI